MKKTRKKRDLPRPYSGGEWTVCRFNTFIKTGLRQVSRRWGPRNVALRQARVSRGIYLCNACKRHVKASKWTVYKAGDKKGQRKKVKNAVVDHIIPVVDPAVGFVDWNTYIQRLFCEVDGLQVLCHDCHERVTAEERERRKK